MLTKLGKDEDAVVKLNRAIELNPDHAQAYYSLSESLRKLGRQEESRAAQERFGALKAADRENIRREAQGLNHFEEGMKALRSNDRLDEAHQWFRKTLEIFPSMGAAYYRLAQIDLLRKRPVDALESIHQAIEINPLDAEYYFILSQCLQETNAPGAMDAIRQAISLKPKTADFHNVLGNLVVWPRRLSDGRRSLQQGYRDSAGESRLSPESLGGARQDGGQPRQPRRERPLFQVDSRKQALMIQRGFALPASALGLLLSSLLTTGAAPVPGSSEVTFLDVTEAAGISFEHKNSPTPEKNLVETMGSGCGFVDFDNDGYLDIFLVNGGRTPGSKQIGPFDHALYRNQRDGTFQLATAAAKIEPNKYYGMGVAVGDFDNDGFDDLFITNFNGPDGPIPK